MGKDRILDPADHTETVISTPAQRTGIGHFLVAGFCGLLLFTGCTFPRIIVLRDPLSPEEHLNLGVAYEESGDLDNAIREYKMAAKRLPMAYLYLGNAHFRKMEFRKAEAYYRRSIKKEPDHPDAYNNLAWLYYTCGEKLDEAEALALKAVELGSPEERANYEDTLEKIRKRKASLPAEGR